MAKKHFALGKEDRILHASGVPISYLDRKVPKFNYANVSATLPDRTIMITPKRQVETYNSLLASMDTFGQSCLYLVGTTPTEQPGYEFLTKISKDYTTHCLTQKTMPKIRWIDMCNPPWDELKEEEPENNIVVIHNITDNSDDRRWNTARDFILKNQDVTVFVHIVSAFALQSMINKMGMVPDGAWQLTASTHKTMI